MAIPAPLSPFVRGPRRVGGRAVHGPPAGWKLLSANNREVRQGTRVVVADETHGLLAGTVEEILNSGAVVVLTPEGLRLMSYPTGGHDPDVPLRLPWITVTD